MSGGGCSLFCRTVSYHSTTSAKSSPAGNAAGPSSTFSQALLGVYRPVRAAHQEEVADGGIYQPHRQDTLKAPRKQMRHSARPHGQFRACLDHPRIAGSTGTRTWLWPKTRTCTPKKRKLTLSSGDCRPSPLAFVECHYTIGDVWSLGVIWNPNSSRIDFERLAVGMAS